MDIRFRNAVPHHPCFATVLFRGFRQAGPAIFAAGLLVMLPACKEATVTPAPTPTPEATPAPAATPAETQSSLPEDSSAPVASKPSPALEEVAVQEAPKEKRLAPDGVLFVVKAFSVINDEGVFGFPVGKKVLVVKRDGKNLLVSDGTFRTTKSEEYFSNDMDLVESLVAQADLQKRAKKTALGADTVPPLN